MKRTILLSIALIFTLAIHAQTSKMITVISPGSLITHLTPDELNTINSLILSGTIDARDFKTMRDNNGQKTIVEP